MVPPVAALVAFEAAGVSCAVIPSLIILFSLKMSESTESILDSIKALARSIDAAIETVVEPKKREDNLQIIIDTQGNTMKAQTDGNAQILEAIKALIEQNSVKQDIIVPAPVVNIDVQPAAPAVNQITVQPAVPAVNNITVKPADVILPAAPTEATITTDRNGNKKLVVR